MGSKTSERWIAYHGADYDLEGENIKLYSYNIKAQREALNKLKNNNVEILDKRFIQNCDNLISKPYWKWRFIPARIIIHKIMSTTGLKAIIYYLGERINLFGFNPHSQFHYYEKNREGYEFTRSHDYKEKELIRKMNVKIYS